MNLLRLAVYVSILGATVYIAGELIGAIKREISEEMK